MTHRKIHWAKSQIGEIDLDAMQESFWDNEKLALSYLEGKFWDEVESIKEAVRKQLLTNWNNYDS
jgi:hypothetical protein